jgi:uncharacterized protein YjdB
MKRALLLIVAAIAPACGDDLGPRVPAAIVVTPEAPQVPVAGTLQLDASVVDASGQAIPGHSLSFSSIDPALLTVDQSGLLTSVGDTGSALITVASGDLTAEVEAEVVLPASAVVVSPRSLELDTQQGEVLLVTVTDARGAPLSDAAVSFASSNSGIARVEEIEGTGIVVTGLTVGSATVTLTSGELTGEVPVTVRRFPTSVGLAPSSLVLPSGTSVQVTAALLDRTGEEMDAPAPFVWSSSDESVATVSSTGMVTSVGPEGSAIITATSDTFSARLGVFVGTPPAGEKVATVPFDLAAEGVAVTSSGRYFVAGVNRFGNGTLPDFAFPEQTEIRGPGVDVVLNQSVSRAYVVGPQTTIDGKFLSGVEVMDLATNSSIDFIPVSLGRPTAGVLSEDETVLTVGTDQGIERIDLATGHSLGGTTVGGIRKVTRHPHEPLLYASGGPGVLELDAESGAIVRRFRGSVFSHAVTSDGTKVYTVNLSGVSVWDLETGEQEELPGNLFGDDVVLSPDDRFLYVLFSSDHIAGGSRVYIVDRLSGALLRTVILGAQSSRIAMAPDGTALITNLGRETGWVDFVR